jgi:hypothetical protein
MGFFCPLIVSLRFEFILLEDQSLLVSQQTLLDRLILKAIGLRRFVAPVTMFWPKNLDIREDINLQKHVCESLRSSYFLFNFLHITKMIRKPLI